ncbi:hypothetical protein [Halomicrobium urmianum]|uniref:hypothetical protein n=1 Tax=Halomicrobium urmianum TaxID=1586233 RepID=UPI001CD9CCB5|nr:hypothetical protein [Halomicrobium urmianum]
MYRLAGLAVLAVALGAAAATGAFAGGDEAVRGVSVAPADGGERYAEIGPDGEVSIELRDLNPRARTDVGAVLIVGADEGPAQVWFDDGRSSVTFYRTDAGAAVESRASAARLASGEAIDVGLRVESGAERLLLESVTVRALVPERRDGGGGSGDGDGAAPTATPASTGPNDGGGASGPDRPGEAGGDGPRGTPTPTPTVDVGVPLPEPSVSVSADGNLIDVTVANAPAYSPVTAALNGTPATRAAGVDLASVALTSSCRGDTGLRVRTWTAPSSPTPAGTRGLFAYDLTPANGSCGFDAVTTRVRVDRAHLDDGPATPDAVRALRRDGGEWAQANATLVATTPEHYVYEVRTAGTADVAVVVGEPAFETTALTATPVEARPGEPITANGTVANVGAGQGEVTARITVDGAVVAERTAVLDPGESLRVAGTAALSEPGTREVRLGDATQTVTVTEATSGTPSDDGTPGVGGLSLLGSIALLVALALLAALYWYRRRRSENARWST